MRAPWWFRRASGLVLLSALVCGGAIASEANERDVQDPLLGYDTGFFARSGDGLFEIKLNAVIQPRFSFESQERAVSTTPEPGTPVGDPDGLGDETDREHTYAFAIPRAQLKLGGHAFSESVRYFFQTDFGLGTPMLKDCWIDFGLVDGALHLKVGQLKRPFSRQWLTSAATLELIERSITHNRFDPGRGLGLMFHNRFLRSPRFEWALGLFNGHGYVPWFEGDVQVDPDTGQGQVAGGKFTNIPDRFRPTIVARLGYNHGGIMGYSEADLEGGGPRFAVAASGLVELDAGDEGDSNVRGELDYAFKLRGFSSTGAVYVAGASSGDFADQAFESIGFHLQAGYVIGGMFQPAVRYALIDPVGEDDRIHRVLGGLAFYFFGHNLKWQIDGGGRLREDPLVGDLTDYTIRTQVQLAF